MLIRVLGLAALVGLAGCVGAPEAPYAPAAYAPAPPPAYAPTYATTPGYVQPGYAQPAYAQPGYAQPGYAAPAAQVASGGRCYAGIYTCELAAALPVGSQCSCPGLGAPSFGTVR